jgi:diacylglycerol O-acyltransferase
MDYTVLISSPQILTRIPGIGSRMPPTYNIIISNVPGPRGKLFFMGAEMEAYYPISALAHGQALNITVLSYSGGLYFGFTGCADKVPHLQRLAVYTGEAIDELERVFVAPPPAPAKKRGKKTKVKTKTKTKTKTKAASPRKR